MLKIGINLESLDKVIAIKSGFKKFILKELYKSKKNTFKFSLYNIVFKSINFLLLRIAFLFYFFPFCDTKYSKSSLSVFSFK